MISDKPYIIVDNQKISPIGSPTCVDSETSGWSGQKNQPFGVVDRVTISREALEKSKWYQTQSELTVQDLKDLSKKQSTTPIPLLTYSPKKLR